MLLLLHMYDPYGTFSFVKGPLQNLYLTTVCQNPIPCCLATSSSSSLGWRLPSAPANVPAPQGDPDQGQNREPINDIDTTRNKRLTAVNFAQVGKLGERATVTERDVDDTVVRERREGVDDGCLLSTARCTRGDEHARKLAYQGT